jgi:hypothetical protein
MWAMPVFIFREQNKIKIINAKHEPNKKYTTLVKHHITASSPINIAPHTKLRRNGRPLQSIRGQRRLPFDGGYLYFYAHR